MAVVGDAVVDQAVDAPPADSSAAEFPASDRGTRAAFWAFVVWSAFAWVKLLFDFGAERWFHRDEWIFLSDWTVGDAFEPFGEHLTALPVLAYRALFHTFGLQYTPYLGLLVTMHVAVAALLRAVMRRAGVRPWLATVGAGSLLLFGAGEDNIQWAFQIGMVGAVLFGLVQLVLADHDGPITRRDWAGLASGGLALLCTGVGPIMVVAVGISTLVRRGWRAAAFHTVPLAALWLTWYFVADPRSTGFGEPPTIEIWRWVREGMIGGFDGLGQLAPVSVALAVLLIGGLVLLAATTPLAELRARAATSVGLLLIAPVLFALTARERWFFGAPFARSGRYVYLVAVFILPALVLAGDAIARRWRYSTPVVILLFLAGMPGNYNRFGHTPPWGPTFFENQRATLLALPYVPEVDDAPGWIRPDPSVFNGLGLTVDFFRDARDDGLVPEPEEIAPDIRNAVILRLGLVQAETPFTGGACTTHVEPIDLHLEHGDRVRLMTGFRAALLVDGQPAPRHVNYGVGDGIGTLSVEAPTLDVQLSPSWGTTEFTICR